MDAGQSFHKLTIPTLVMIIVANVMSPMGIVVMDQYGETAIFYYLLVILFFFIPSVFVFSELGSAFPEAGGIYNWVKKAFGKRAGNVALWSQWLGVVLSFPVVLSFAASVLVYPISPKLANDGSFIFWASMIILLIAWIASNISLGFSKVIGYVAAFLTSLIPLCLVMCLAIVWLAKGHPSSTAFGWDHIVPDFTSFSTFSLIGATIFMFSGMEVAANYQKYTKHAHIAYSKAVVIAAFVIIFLSVGGTLAISVLVPHRHTSLIAGLIQAFVAGSDALGIFWLPYVAAGMIALGLVGVLSLFFIALSKGIQAAAEDGVLPKYFAKENEKGLPLRLVFGMVLMTFLATLLFLVIPTVNEGYWIIEAMVILGSSIRYLLLFVGAIKLRYTKANVKRLIKVPGGNIGMWIMSGICFLMILFADVMTFFPPDQFAIGNIWVFEGLLVFGALLFIILPLFFEWLVERMR